MRNLIKKILRESEEDDFEWAKELVSTDYSDIKWIRTDDGKRFKNSRDRLGYGNSYITPWSRFNGWDNWWKVDRIELVDDKLCFITSLHADSTPRTIFYFTPVEDYNQHEMSSSVERPKVGNEKKN